MSIDERTGPDGVGTGPGVQADCENNFHDTEQTRRPVEAALELAAAGWPVLPCRAHDLDDRRKAKAPIITHGHSDASLNPA